MKLKFIEMCGFRGFKGKARIDFAHGFTVVTGRNGVGKSTICDAVEFALTGSIDKYAVEKAAKETLNDYLWWRGDGVPSECYVTVSFVSEDGKVHTTTRTPESGLRDGMGEIESALCTERKPENALQQLCRTSIIRDEWIAALSLDLTETERFELVRSALGDSGSADYASRAREVLAFAESARQRVERDYDLNRNSLTTALTQLSQTKELAARSTDLDSAMKVIATEVTDAPVEIAARLSFVRSELTRRRVRLRKIQEQIEQARELSTLRQDVENSESKERRERVRRDLAQAERARTESFEQLKEAEQAFELIERTNDLAASLAALVDHGARLGLHEGHCPLCDAQRSVPDFEQGILVARQRAELLAAHINDARQTVAAARTRAAQSEATLRAVVAVSNSIEREIASFASRIELHRLTLGQLNLSETLVAQPNDLQREHDSERDRLIDIERALLTLEASQAITKVAADEDRVAVLRLDSDKTAADFTRWQAAVERARLIERATKRVAGEIIDERLAQISPLLNELYQRLRPHTDWRSIEYSIRGDVRRFLSLRVGNGLNPQFVFSSGQRRAAGLAFLLAVHLTRNWTRWRTLILDDPIQHIDDFRALHLVEVLAALRRDGRQIVCAVEDQSLADLLCRRLSGAVAQEGRKYVLEPGAEGSIDIAATELPPLVRNVLRQRPGLQAAAG